MKNIVTTVKNEIFNLAVCWNSPNMRSNWKSLETKMRLFMIVQLMLCISAQLIVAAESGGASNDASTLITSLINVMISIFKYVGIGLIVWGIIQFLLAVKKSDAESKSEAVTTAIVGIALFSLATIINAMNIGGLGNVNNGALDGTGANGGSGL